MAFNSFLRRASSSIIPMSMRSVLYRRQPHGAISVLNAENRRVVGGQFPPFVRFSSTVTDNNIASLLGSPNATPIADKSHFEVQDYYFPYDLCLIKESRDERIFVSISSPYFLKGQAPVSPMQVLISRGNDQRLYFDLFAKPDQFKIFEINMRNKGGDHLENFEEFVMSKGVNSGMINMLFDRFGIKPKNNTPANP